MLTVKRTFTEATNKDSNASQLRSLPPAAYEDTPAYVVLGNPGAGKTTFFEEEAKKNGAIYLTARDMIIFKDLQEWHNKILFIDGLDEIRAGSNDSRTPLDSIRACLKELGQPRFRLSCREADWFGATDQGHLQSVSPNGAVTVLHLDPLTEENIIEILSQNLQVGDPVEFVHQAKQRGLGELLPNPHILKMLAKATADGTWPETRKQTFELACQTIIREHNPEHIHATQRSSVNIEQQLNAAGFLCAALLISGSSGFAQIANNATDDFPALRDLNYEHLQDLQDVVHTKLFKIRDENLIIPVHRQIAEYLAASFLSSQIDISGLPIQRVLALITGDDGFVVSELRGLSAWLASLCHSQRTTIIDRDPLGVVLYGDTHDFTPPEKHRILEGLRTEAEHFAWFRSEYWTSSPFGALATPDMESEFNEILSSDDRSEPHQAMAECVLDALAHGTAISGLDNTLIKLFRDASWRPHVRRAALEAIRHQEKLKGLNTSTLQILLKEIQNGTVMDADDDFMGRLLSYLYPGEIPASKILTYLHTPKRRNYIGRYLAFWDRELLELTPDREMMALLDSIVKQQDELQDIIDDHHLRDLTIGILAHGLALHGETIHIERLYQWLKTGLSKHGYPRSGKNRDEDKIRAWLEAHPDIQKSIIEFILTTCTEKEHFSHCVYKQLARLYHAKLPQDYARWCLEKMRLIDNQEAAHYLLRQAFDAVCYQYSGTDITLEDIQKVVNKTSTHAAWLNEFLACHVDPEEQTYKKNQRRRDSEKAKKKQEWYDFVKPHQTALREGRAYPRLLHDIASAYSGHFTDSEGETPIERLRNFLNQDETLVQSALIGLNSTLQRADLPEASEIIRLYTQDRTHNLCKPILIAASELTQPDPNRALKLSDKVIRLILAVHLVDGTNDEPQWYIGLLNSRPELTANILATYALAGLRSKKPHITGLYGLANNDAYHLIAEQTSLEILKHFPARSTSQQLSPLNELLKAALRHADRPQLLALVEKKLSLKSMDIAQRTRWLATGMIALPEKYLQPLVDFVGAQEKRIQHLASFLIDRDKSSIVNELSTTTIGLLIKIIGQFFAPYTFDGATWVSPAISISDFTNSLISRLGSQPEAEAATILDDLLSNKRLHAWEFSLQRARHEQRAVRREADFKHPDILQVIKTLNNSAPANAGDLAALLMAILSEMAGKIRNGNTDDYRQFWNEGARRKLGSPKHEDDCRDALLSDLQVRLAPLGIDAQPEGHYADDKRADIRVSFGGFGGFEVPIEIKKNAHPNLWSAMHHQLIKLYCKEPRASGYGIYLVFWFGADRTQAPPTGKRPKTAQELESRLLETLSTEQRRKISVCVIDVAPPD